MNNTERDHVTKFIKDRFIMVVGVSDHTTPSLFTAFYVTDDAHTLYYKSRTQSNHSRIVATNPTVAVVIYDHQSSYSKKAGIQATGVVERVQGLSEMGRAVELYSRAFKGSGEKFAALPELVSEFVKSTLYKITLQTIKMVDTESEIEMTEYQDW